MRRPRSKLEVSTFPFLAVLLCAMGSLLLLLFIMDRRAKVAAQNNARESIEARKKRTQEEEDARQAAWKKAQEQLHQALELQQEQLFADASTVNDKLNHVAKGIVLVQSRHVELEQQVKSEKDKIKEEKNKIAAIQVQIAGRREELKKAEKEEMMSKAELLEATKELAELEIALLMMKQVKEREKAIYSVVPYRGKRGDMRPPIYIECVRSGVIFHPEQKLVNFWEIRPEWMRDEVERRAGPLRERQAILEKNSPLADSAKKPYVLFLIRPDGITNYYKAQAALHGYHLDFGYELVDEGWVLDFTLDPYAKSQATSNPSKGPIANAGIGFGTGNGGAGSGDGPGGPYFGNSGNSNGGYPGNAGSGRGTGPGGPYPGPGGSSAGLPYAGNGNAGPGGPFPGPGGSMTGPSTGKGGSGNGTGSGGYTTGPYASNANAGSGGPYPNPGGNVNGPYPGSGGSGAVGLGTSPLGGAPAVEPGGVPLLPPPPAGYAPGLAATSLPPPPLGGNPGSFGTAPPPLGTNPNTNATSVSGYGTPGSNGLPNVAGGAPSQSSIGNPPYAGPDAKGPSFVPITRVNGANSPAFLGNPNTTQTPGTPGAGGPITPEMIASAGPGNATGNPPSATPGVLGSQPGAGDNATPRQPGAIGNGSNAQGSGDGDAMPGPRPLPGYGADKPRKTIAPVPLSKMLGNKDFLITIDCYGDHVNVFPGGTLHRWTAGNTQAADQQLVQTITNLIARRQASVRPGEPPYQPLIRFQVSAEGLRTYYHAYPLLEHLRVPMSRENVAE